MSQVAEMDFEAAPGARLRTALATIRTDVDQAFEQWLPVPDDTRAPLVEAMRHAAIGGGKRVRFIDTPHTPHGWDAGVLFEESTGTLMCGDLFTQLGNAYASVVHRAVSVVWEQNFILLER